ncbi:Cytoskeleton-associated protein 5 [Psilocybe cubensis]|uniref:Cytoskeleton-associated protein 5 n=1 Tax=Psilocybe cubensis TaxID=181762 RepID=A0ACB8H9B9_PSICU|nr:Cytoskeleton-associated protein 5 [Psilocybe cubensis]KAH9484304.1 Cytoskeleton-associated protein 5 [Psilocybe cubensis]
MNGEFLAARQLLGEAIDTARLSNDRVTLHHCTSILHRLPPLDEAQKPILQEVQPDLHPFEILFDVSKLLNPESVRMVSLEQPLSASFIKIFQAIGLYDHWLDVQCAVPVEEQQWAQHAVQSIVWREAGCSKLADIEQNVVLAFTEPGGQNSNRMAVSLNKSYQIARQGNYTAALASLIDPNVWRGLYIQDYAIWAHAIWDILALRATRRGQLRLYRELLIPRRPNGPFNPKEYSYNVESDKLTIIRESLYQILQLKQQDQAVMGIDHLLRALWYSEFLCRFSLYRTAIIILADIGLEFGLTQKSRRIIEEIMPQVINGDDIEQRAVACFTLARCIIVAEGSTSEALQQALPYLSQAEYDFKTLEMYRPLQDVQYMLSVVYHNLDMPMQRQAAAERHFETEGLQRRLEMIVSDPEILKIFDLVEVVGSALTSSARRVSPLFTPVCIQLLVSADWIMDGPPPQEEDFTTLPISERLAHKNWKARVSAYESLIKTFGNTASDTDPAFKPYINNVDLLKKFATDANAVAQEKGVECLVALVKFAGESAAKTREGVVPALVDKCLGSTRVGTKNQAIELVMQYVEVENGGAGVVADLLVGLSAKQPKAVAGCILALKEVVRNFGVQVVPSPPILKALPKIFAHSDKTVRAEGSSLTTALYQYIGPGIEPWLAELKPVQVKELKDSFEALEKEGKGHKTLKPEKLTRAQSREVVEEGADEAQEEPEDMAPPDPRTMAEVVDITPKLPASLQTNLKSSKWKERKEALDDLSTLLSATPRIKDAPELAELSKMLAACVAKDANINCVIVAATCLTELAKGIMSPFAKYREHVVPPMLERLKERKANVTDAIGAALDAVFATTTLADLIPDLDAAFKSKNPQVKEGTLKFLGRSLASATTPIPPAQIKPLADTLAVLLEDGYEGARTEAAVCFGTLMKMVGERPLNATMESIPDLRKAKIKEAFEAATVKCKAGGAPPRAPAAAAAPVKKPPTVAKPAPVPKPVVQEEEPPPKKVAPPPKPAAKPAPPKPAAAPAPKKAAPSNATSKPAAKPGAQVAAGNLDTVKYKHTPEDAEALAAELLPGQVLTDLGDANWKTRLAALEELTPWIEAEIQTVDAEVVVRALAKKGWNEKNFQVSAKLYGILAILAQGCPSFGRSCVALSVPHLTEKLGDLKLKKPAGDTLLAFAEKTSLQFVFSQAYEPLSKQKAPKTLADSIGWMNTALIDFGIAGLSLRGLIDFLKAALQNSNAAVRTSATKTLVTVKIFAGSSIKDLIEDLNPQLLNTITSEFDKVEGQSPPEPCRTSADLANAAPEASKGSKAAASDPLDDLFPRVDLDSLFKGTTILVDANSAAWKTKKEALEALQGLLDQGSNKRLKPSMGEIGQILKARVTDTNKAVQVLALDIVSKIATGMGKPFDKHARLLVLPICTALSDQKSNIRGAAVQTLTAIATACESLEPMIPGITTGIETPNPLQKATLLQWIVDWFKENSAPSSLDLRPWAPAIVASLDDRSADVRKAAQALLPSIIQCTSFDFVLQQTNSLKPASRNSAIPLINAARPVVSTTEPTPKPAPAPKAAAVSKVSTSPDPPPASPVPDSPVAPTPTESKPSSKLGVRRKLPQGLSRPESRAEIVEPATRAIPKKLIPPTSSMKQATQAPPSTGLPFSNMNVETKKSRLGKDASRWINEGGPTRKDLADALQTQMEPHTSQEVVAKLFSHDHNAINDYIAGLTTIADFYTGAVGGDESIEKLCIANLDLPLKYISIKAHEPQPNLISKCLDVTEAILAFLRSVNYQLTDNEAMCFVPTIIFKLGDAREQVRSRTQQIIRTLPTVYAYSRVFQLLLDHGLKAKVAKTRQGTLDEMSAILKKSGMGACEPAKAFPAIASLLSDKDPQVRKSTLGTLSEAYILVGEKVWSLVGPLSAKDKTQLEERLRRVPGPSSSSKTEPAAIPVPAVSRIAAAATAAPRSASPSLASVSRLARPASPANPLRSASPALSRPDSPSRREPTSTISASSAAAAPPPSSPAKSRPRSMLPSRLGRPRPVVTQPPATMQIREEVNSIPIPSIRDEVPADHAASSPPVSRLRPQPTPVEETVRNDAPDDIVLVISTIMSSDPSRSVDALKKIQKILAEGPEKGPSLPQYRELAEHTEGLIETITLQMAHIFEHPKDLVLDENFRLAKHLIQTLNNFCDHTFLAESLTVDIVTALLEELTLRLLETDDSSVKKVKDLSRFINMIILRLFATGRRMTIFRNGVLPDSKEAKVAELVLKCVWKLARNIPQDLAESFLDPVELFPAIEHFLQSIPPNEWRARATNKVPCGDMPLRTIKVIIQHVVAHYGDDVYELLSASFEDPSATIVYPYVYRILNSNSRTNAESQPLRRNGMAESYATPASPGSSRPMSPHETASSVHSHHRPSSHRTSPTSSANGGNGLYSPNVEEPDPDAQLLVIIGHISSETTGALHKEGITELHHFLKAYPHKKPRVDKLLENTGAAFRKYINRALASRAAEDQERNVAVADTLSKLEYNSSESKPSDNAAIGSPEVTSRTPVRTSALDGSDQQERLSRLHDIFQYRSSTISSGSSHGRSPSNGVRTSMS